MPGLGRTLVVVGLAIAALGIVLTLAPRLPWLGHLPGDIHVEGERWAVHIPLVTCLIVSAVLTVLLNIFFRH
jgi:DUF2905 family protein